MANPAANQSPPNPLAMAEPTPIWHTLDMPGIREQILENVHLAFPCLSPNKTLPPCNASGKPFTISLKVTRYNEQRGPLGYVACVLYGPENKIFINGGEAANPKSALIFVLDVTAFMVGQLYRQKLLNGSLGEGKPEETYRLGQSGVYVLAPTWGPEVKVEEEEEEEVKKEAHDGINENGKRDR